MPKKSKEDEDEEEVADDWEKQEEEDNWDPDFEEFVYRIAKKHGWPKGPITGFMLWNEPWEGLSISGWGADMLPWYGQELEKTQAIMGDNFYSYGLQSNKLALNTLFRYSHEQDLASRLLTVDELFHPSGMALEEA